MTEEGWKPKNSTRNEERGVSTSSEQEERSSNNSGIEMVIRVFVKSLRAFRLAAALFSSQGQ